ncbi:unannotated protein [freshwater metagenome]|uniref:Unannotated protein n=1 Tax=freshwater metagenome TaxID=449393 RepID=A0A6J7KWD5_9ZZZZ
MTDDTNIWQAPEVTPFTEAEGASADPQARIRNGVPLSGF